MAKLYEFDPKDYGELLAVDKIDASGGVLTGNNAGGKIPANSQNRTILIGLGGAGVKTINAIKRRETVKVFRKWYEEIIHYD